MFPWELVESVVLQYRYPSLFENLCPKIIAYSFMPFRVRKGRIGIPCFWIVGAVSDPFFALSPLIYT